MLRTLNSLEGYSLRATDGDIGRVHDFCFDDDQWVVRYFVVDTGSWLGRRVLVSPTAFVRADWDSSTIEVALTKEQVRNSPSVDLHRPVSRQYETDYYAYLEYTPYWAAPYPGPLPDGHLAAQRAVTEAKRASEAPAPVDDPSLADSHLRSSKEVRGYHIHATDGEIGHVDDFVADDRSWAIQFIQVDTSNWIGGKSVLVPRAALDRVSWADGTLHVVLTRAQVENSPEYDSSRLSADTEQRLDTYYGSAHRAEEGRTTT